MAIIQDSQTGTTAKVDSENRLYTFAVSQTEDKHSNLEGLYDSIYFDVTPAGADDTFFYLKNTGLGDLAITDIRISSSVATNIFLDHVTGTPTYVTGTDAEITNRNLGSSYVPSVVAKYDTNITGLVNAGVLLFQECPTADTMYHFRTSSNIIIPQGQAIGLRRVAGTGLITCLVSLSISES